jgi:hypothetical protein
MHGVRLVSTPAMKRSGIARAGLDVSCAEIPEKSIGIRYKFVRAGIVKELFRTGNDRSQHTSVDENPRAREGL